MTDQSDQTQAKTTTEPLVHSPYRREGDLYLIDLRLTSLDQLFDTRDPAPFHERDLDPDAEDYFLECLREVPSRAPVKIRIHCPATSGITGEMTAAAISNFFAYRRWAQHLKLREHFRQARVALLTGVLFLTACLGASELTLLLPWPLAARIVSEGLFIVGWVAMWRPAELFLYGWWPHVRQERLHARLAAAPVEVRSG